MKQSTMEAFVEVDAILNLMDNKYVEEIPIKLRQLFKEKKSEKYVKIIEMDKPLEEQNLREETLNILAVLNYNYWCKDKEKKRQLIDLYSENERIYQEKLRRKYNPDDIFKDNKNMEYVEQTKNQMTIVEDKVSIFTKIKRFLKNIIKNLN